PFSLLTLSTPPPPPSSTLFPYTTLFRSARLLGEAQSGPEEIAFPRDYRLATTDSRLPWVRRDVIARERLERRAGQAKIGRLRGRSEEHTSELQSLTNIVCRLLLEKKKVS